MAETQRITVRHIKNSQYKKLTPMQLTLLARNCDDTRFCPRLPERSYSPIGCVGLGSSFDSGRTKTKQHSLQVLELDVQKQKQKGALADRTPDPAMTCGIETAIACSTTELKLQIYRTHPCAISARF